MFVVKVGGSEGIDYDAFINDLSNHDNYVIVHCGSSELNQVSTKLGHPPKFVESVSGFTPVIIEQWLYSSYYTSCNII